MGARARTQQTKRLVDDDDDFLPLLELECIQGLRANIIAGYKQSE